MAAVAIAGAAIGGLMGGEGSSMIRKQLNAAKCKTVSKPSPFSFPPLSKKKKIKETIYFILNITVQIHTKQTSRFSSSSSSSSQPRHAVAASTVHATAISQIALAARRPEPSCFAVNRTSAQRFAAVSQSASNNFAPALTTRRAAERTFSPSGPSRTNT